MPQVPRRGFLRRCCKAAAAALLPARLYHFAFAELPEPDFFFHPHYREQTPLDETLAASDAVDNSFVSEKHNSQILPTLKLWADGLLKGSDRTQQIAKTLSAEFQGTSPHPTVTHPARIAKGGLSCERVQFSQQSAVKSEDFIGQLKAEWANLSKLQTADLQVTRIEEAEKRIITHILFELVGSGDGFFREQRVGHWLLDWVIEPAGSYRVIRWQMEDEVRSRCITQAFFDITGHAFGSNKSYLEQMSHGADYWRTILDASTGVDVYGHNGISVGDINGDGCDDIYVCQPAGLPNRLFRNRGDGTFEDITASSGVGLLDNTSCAIFADFNNNGHQDLLIVRTAGPLLFLNQGNGKFVERPNAFRFANPPLGTFTGASVADYDRNGLLDIYFCLYTFYKGTDQYKYPTPYFAAENGPPNFLMRNNGDGTFSDVTEPCGLNNNTRYSFCCQWNDYNQDGWPDLYVVNDFGLKNLYRNNGDGTFTDVAESAGVEDIGAGMSVSWLDYDNDGKPDLYVANMWTADGERLSNDKRFQESAGATVRASYRKHAMGNSLLKNVGPAFKDVTGGSHAGRARWAWSSDAWDFDHDGYADVYVANGMISGPIHKDLNSFFWRKVVAKSPNTFKSDADYELGWNAINELVRSDHSWSGYERNVLFANNRDSTFCDVSGAVGLDFLDDARAFALADFDGDGRQELIIKNRNAPQLRFVKNAIQNLPPSLAFRVQGTRSNRDAIGASVTIRTSLGNQTKWLQAGSGFLSQHSKEFLFGLGDADGPVSATIRWPNGLVQEIRDLQVNHRVSVREGVDHYEMEPFQAPRPQITPAHTQKAEEFPSVVSTWMLSPVPTPKLGDDSNHRQPHLLTFHNSSVRAYEGAWPTSNFRVTEINTDEHPNEELSTVYSLLFRYLFDRHRDLPLPTSFLVNQNGEIVKVYQGKLDIAAVTKDSSDVLNTDGERLTKALPFVLGAGTFEFARNYLSLGSILFQHGYPDYAEGFFQSAVKQDSSSAEAVYGLGSVYLKQGKNTLARNHFEEALKLTASHPETVPNTWNNLGLLATRGGKIDDAITCFKQAIQANPDHFVALENLGNAYKQQKRWQEAQSTLELAVSIKPNDAEANYSLGMVWAQMEDAQKAYEYLNKALQARPVYPEALNNLAILMLRTRRRNEAVAGFEKCIQLAPGFEQSYLNLARVYMIEGNLSKAHDVLDALLAQHPDSAAARLALSQLP